jgi:hypothetical protein
VQSQGASPLLGSASFGTSKPVDPAKGDVTDFVRLFGLDRLPSGRRMGYRWRRESDGGLPCLSEPDIVAKP